MKKIVEVLVCKTKTGYSAHIDEIPGIAATGKSLDEIKKNMTEAVELHIKGLKEDGDILPDSLQGEYELLFRMDVESLLDYFDGILTQTALSRLTGINIKQLNHYARGKSKPRPAQIRKIEQGLHKLGVELMEINL
jgi:predicted RNase H-like HicB family nuclease